MKKTIIILCATIAIVSVLFTKCSKSDNYKINYSVQQSNNFTNLPALQSFAFGKHEEYWIMIGGRTNGFHGFQHFHIQMPINLYMFIITKQTN